MTFSEIRPGDYLCLSSPGHSPQRIALRVEDQGSAHVKITWINLRLNTIESYSYRTDQAFAVRTGLAPSKDDPGHLVRDGEIVAEFDWHTDS